MVGAYRAGEGLHRCVAVDGTRKRILDSEENRPMHVSEEALRSCGGDGVQGYYIAEVCELYDSKVPNIKGVVEIDQ